MRVQVSRLSNLIMGTFTMRIGAAKLRLSGGDWRLLSMLTLSEKVGTSIQFLYGGKIYPIRVTAAVTHCIAELRLQGSGYRDDRGRDLLLKVKVNQAQTSQVTRLRD